jgi:hypothetical protein
MASRKSAGEADPAVAGSPSLDEALLVGVPTRLGELLASMERWVVQSVTSAVGATARIAAWIVAQADEHLVTTPADRAASGLQRAAAAIEPWVGVSPAKVCWALLAVAALAVLVHAAWPGG